MKDAIHLLLSWDADTYQIIFLSLFVSLTSSILGFLFGSMIGFVFSLKKFPLKSFWVRLLYTFVGIPPVVAGLVVYLILSRRGLLGGLELLFTPVAMMIAQTILIVPIVAVYVYHTANEKAAAYLSLGRTLGASKMQRGVLLLRELKKDLMVSYMNGYGRAISEVGAVMIVGGNIENKTRVMTTAISTKVSMGQFDKAIALGIILLLISFLIQTLLYNIQGLQNAITMPKHHKNI